MDRLAYFVTATALALAGVIILGPGGASILAQYLGAQYLGGRAPRSLEFRPFQPVRALLQPRRGSKFH